MAWHVILCSIGYVDVPNKGIEQVCSWASCDIHISPLVLIYTVAFSNVLLVLALNFMAHKSSYCKCSLAWCQVRTFLLFTIWIHPLQMREYLLQYAGTDRIKKSHNRSSVHVDGSFREPQSWVVEVEHSELLCNKLMQCSPLWDHTINASVVWFNAWMQLYIKYVFILADFVA